VLILAQRQLGFVPFGVSSELRDLLLVIFFAGAGLGTTLSSWIAAGRPLITLSIVSLLLMVFQNLIGISIAAALGVPAAYGVLTGSVAFVGGLGSAVAWGAEFAAAGVQRAAEVAIMAATLGMVLGTFLAGPYVSWVIRREKLSVPRGTTDAASEVPQAQVPLIEKNLVVVFFLFALSIAAGDVLREWLRDYGVVVPRFLTAMLAGLGISTLADLRGIDIHRPLIDRSGEVCLSLFIVIALCGIDLSTLARLAGPLALLAFAQTIGTLAFVHLFVFRSMGRDFEAATTAGGVIGFGLSSFAVAMATVKQVERNYGPAPKSFLLTTLVGGAVSNVANALVTLGFYQWLTRG
jgi:ESS family glutamate:Na+ symporter